MYEYDDILDSATSRRPSPLAFALAAMAAAGLTGAAVGGLAWVVDYSPASTTSFDTTTGFDPGTAQVGNSGPSASAVPFVSVPQPAQPDPAQAGVPVDTDRGRIRPETVVVDEREGRPAGVPPVAVPAVPVPAVPVPVPADAVPAVPEVPDVVPNEPMPFDAPAAVAPATDPWTGQHDWQDPAFGMEPAPIETTTPQRHQRQQHDGFEGRHRAPAPQGNPLFDHWFFR